MKAELNIVHGNYLAGRTMHKKTVVVTLLVLAFLVAFHQFYYWQTWFNVDDIHHETFVVALICLALGILLSEKLEGARP